MRNARRAGFSLIELLMSLVVMAIVSNGVLAVLLTMQRVTRRQSEVAAMQGSLRSGLQLIQAELTELATNQAAGTADITTLTNQTLSYRAMRGLGETCEVSSTAVKLQKASYAGLRPPTPGRDGLWLYLDGDSTQTDDDSWVSLPISSVTATTCPDGAAGWALSVSLDPDDVARAGVPGPARTFEEMEIGQLHEDGQDWLGIRSVGFGEETLIPVTGPVTWNGVRFAYFDRQGVETTDATAVATIEVTLRGVTDRAVSGASGGGGQLANPTDSLSFTIRLRNAP